MQIIKYFKLKLLCNFMKMFYNIQTKIYDEIILLAKELNVKLIDSLTKEQISLNETDKWWEE